jgi:hypothetical protein
MAVLKEFARSGDSIEKFCAKRRIRVKTLKWWRWTLGDAPSARRKDVRLVPVDVIGLAAPRPTTIAITIAALELRVEVGTDVAYVGELVRALRSRC